MSAPSFGLQVDRASGEVRAAYLRRVLGLTFVGLSIAAFTGLLGMAALMLVPSLLSGYVPMVIVLGMWAITNYVARPMVFGNAKWAGFLLGTVADGIALSFILTIAALVSMADYGNPFVLVALAVGLTAASGTGLAAFAFTQRRDFSMLGAFLSAMFIPMLVLMAIGLFMPGLLGGTFGLVIAAVFVVISAAGLLYQLNQVIHTFRTDMHVEGAYTITIGVLVLFWNILSLLMRLRRR